MNYIECNIVLKPFKPWNEIVVAQLNTVGFESFVEEESASMVKAYTLEDQFNEKEVEAILNSFQPSLSYSLRSNVIEKENWNQRWEESFEPVEVGKFCHVRAPFHRGKQGFKFELIVEPKMSFGTGHHQTTQMMIELMAKIDFKMKSVLDMGSGTGILAILAKKMGAKLVRAIDIEEWAYENMKENFKRNEVEVEPYLGGEELIKSLGQKYDVIIANINKNILLQQLSTYTHHLNHKGDLLLSGFYLYDIEEISRSKSAEHYCLHNQLSKDDWSSLHFKKE